MTSHSRNKDCIFDPSGKFPSRREKMFELSNYPRIGHTAEPSVDMLL